MDHFEVFGLPRKLAIDTTALQRAFYELQKRYHPDFQGNATPEEQANALDASARLNAAYRALRDPIARVEYLVRLEEGREARPAGGRDTRPAGGRDTRPAGGRDTNDGATVKPKAPPELLAEMFEIQEALAEAKAGGLDDGTRATLGEQRERLAARSAEEAARVTGPLSAEWDAADVAARPAVLAKLKTALATRAYLRTVIDDLAQALELGEGGQGEHVTHHRH